MSSLTHLLNSIKDCTACRLMKENQSFSIPYIPILPKPSAHFMFMGRDPSPRTATTVGTRGGKSAFINEIFKIADDADVSDDDIYITDLCKCHWRTSAGSKPWPKTENRLAKLDVSVAQTCLDTWLMQEIEIIKPRLTVAFGEELYQLLKPFIVDPNPAPKKLSARADKSVPDAERWFVNNGPLTLNINGTSLLVAFLRHAGNSRKLPQSTNADKRLQFYEASTQRVIQLLQGGKF